jgi:hypothetical protein
MEKWPSFEVKVIQSCSARASKPSKLVIAMGASPHRARMVAVIRMRIGLLLDFERTINPCRTSALK